MSEKKDWKARALEMIGGESEPPRQRKTFSTEKKTVQAAGDENIPEEVLNRYKKLYESGVQDISLEDLIADYYGGSENLQKEIAKAKEARASRDPKSREDKSMEMYYDKISEKIPVRSSRSLGAHYNVDDKEAVVSDPEAYTKFIAQVAEKGLMGSKEDEEKFNQMLSQNRYTRGDYAGKLKNPLSEYIGVVEHEVGHHASGTSKEGNLGMTFTHMSDKGELANQLGRIQREAYQLYGERFTPETLEDFMVQQENIPSDERFQNFSPDTRRGLRELYDAYKGENPMLKENQRIWPAAKARIPEFVKREGKSKQKTA
jgi:hypothetical protein